ncbi:TetR/AcrR family transcriptional regulator [Nocardia stercoris]|nr:TetR family transcriptional regulator [Nocardia stercoris]
MPRIDAASIAEHRANQERVLLAAARELLVTSGRTAVTPAAVGAAAGLARSSVYKYFASADEILARIVADAFRDWGVRVAAAVASAPTPGDRIDTYVRTTLALAASGEHRVAVLGGDIPQDEPGRAKLAEAHHNLAAPLREVLRDMAVADPGLVAELVDGALGKAIARLDAGEPIEPLTTRTLEFVRGAVGLTRNSDQE